MPTLPAELAALPFLANARECVRLGGLTNVVYRVDGYAVRLPGAGTEGYIDRQVEAHNARVAADAGVAPELVYCDPATGVLATRFLPDAVTMTAAGFKDRPGAPARAGEALRRLHAAPAFTYRFELFAKVDEYLAYLETHPAPLPAGYHDVLARCEAIRAVLAAKPAPLAPCHCDPLAENFLDDGERMWIVDWEYSGMNDPMWDLGDLSVEAEFGPAEDAELLAAYFGGDVPAAARGRFEVYKAMCDVLWTLWGLIQHANGNPAEDFLAYASNRFERGQKQLASPGFAEHLAAI